MQAQIDEVQHQDDAVTVHRASIWTAKSPRAAKLEQKNNFAETWS